MKLKMDIVVGEGDSDSLSSSSSPERPAEDFKSKLVFKKPNLMMDIVREEAKQEIEAEIKSPYVRRLKSENNFLGPNKGKRENRWNNDIVVEDMEWEKKHRENIINYVVL